MAAEEAGPSRLSPSGTEARVATQATGRILTGCWTRSAGGGEDGAGSAERGSERGIDRRHRDKVARREKNEPRHALIDEFAVELGKLTTHRVD
jgi:hypothetical protein